MGWVGRVVLLVEFVDFGFGNDVACETLMHGFSINIFLTELLLTDKYSF